MEPHRFQLSPGRWKVAVVLLALLAALLHFDAINNGMVFDDHFAVQHNNVIKDGFDIVRIAVSRFWGDTEYFHISAWRPFTTLTFALNHAVHGMSPAGYHLVNLLLHGLTVALTALLARRLGASQLSALCAALLFAVHPIHVEAVVPIVGRADLLLGAAGLGAVLLWEERKTALALVCLAVALLSKEMGVVVAALITWRELTRNGFPKKPVDMRFLFPLLLAALWLIARYAVVGEIEKNTAGALENPLANAGFSVRLWTASALYLRLLGLMIYPAVLLREYSFAIIVPEAGPSVEAVAGLLLLIASIAAPVIFARRHPALSFASALWIGGFLLVSNLGPTTPMIFAERVFYLPSAGLLIFCLLSLEAFARRPKIMQAAWIAAAAASVALGARSVIRIEDWRNDTVLTQASLRDGPDCIKTLVDAAATLTPNGLLTDEEALSLLHRAEALKPDHPLPHLGLAKYYVVHDREQKALAHIDRAERLSRGYPGLISVQCAYTSKFALHAAEETCRRAVKARPNDPSNWSFLGISLDKLDKPAEADVAFRTALEKMKSPRADLLLNYGVFLAGRGRLGAAGNMFQNVLQINPKDKEAAAYLEETNRLMHAAPRR